MSSLIQLENVSLRRSDKSILSNVTLDVVPDQFMTIIGPNGSGKTTLIRIILGLLTPTQGVVKRQKNLKIGYVPQKISIDYALPLQVKDFLSLFASESCVHDVLESVGASHLLKCSVHHLSGGEFQRMMLAQALIKKPDLLVLDEPLQGVDVVGQESLYALIAETQKKYRCTVVLVSHDLHFVHTASDRVICLNGHICCAGKPQEVRASPEYLALFKGKWATNLAIYQHHHDHAHEHEHKRNDSVDGCNHD